jgi:hypothetical protein
MDHLLDLEWTVVDEVNVALAEVDSQDPSPAAQPSVPRPATPTGQPPSGTPQPGSPHEKHQGTTASSHNTAEDTAPARTPVPAQIAKDIPEDVCDGVEYEECVEDNPYGRGPQATRLPRPESLCWRCGVPGHSRGDCRPPVVLFCSRCGTMGLMSRDCPCPRPPWWQKVYTYHPRSHRGRRFAEIVWCTPRPDLPVVPPGLRSVVADFMGKSGGSEGGLSVPLIG